MGLPLPYVYIIHHSRAKVNRQFVQNWEYFLLVLLAILHFLEHENHAVYVAVYSVIERVTGIRERRA